MNHRFIFAKCGCGRIASDIENDADGSFFMIRYLYGQRRRRGVNNRDVAEIFFHLFNNFADGFFGHGADEQSFAGKDDVVRNDIFNRQRNERLEFEE